MSDEKSVWPVTVALDVSPETRSAIINALMDQEHSLIRALVRVFDYQGWDAEESVAAYESVKELIPTLTDERWRRVTGMNPPSTECDEAMSCCGYCNECDSHHGDDRDEVCNMGHCHECEHSCDR